MTKYVHVRRGPQGTIAVDIPSKEYIEQLFKSHANQAYINVGVAKLHPKDQFVKKIGREKASSKMSFQVATLQCVYIEGIRHVYYFNFESSAPNLKGYQLVFATTAESENVLLLDGGLW